MLVVHFTLNLSKTITESTHRTLNKTVEYNNHTNLHKPMVDIKFDILLLIVFCNNNVTASRLQLFHLKNSKSLMFNRECSVNNISNIIFPAMEAKPYQTIVTT